MSYIKEVTQEKNNHDYDILKVSDSGYRSCLICGSRDCTSKKIQINRKHGRGNVVTFNMCPKCLKEFRRSFINLKL